MSTTTHHLRERIEAVSSVEADETRLVSLAVPAEGSVGDALEQVEEDRAEAEYIDEDAPPEPLRKVLEELRRVLGEYDETPENGLVAYVGVVGDDDVVEYVFDDLPNPVAESVYEQGNEFETEPLEAVGRSGATYGLLVVEHGGAALGRLEGETVEPLETVESEVLEKTDDAREASGEYENRRKEQLADFYEDVADAAARAFLATGPETPGGGGDAEEVASDAAERAVGGGAAEAEAPERSDDLTVDGLLVGGTTIAVEQFGDGEYLDERLRDVVVADEVPVEYASEQGLRQLAEKAENRVEAVEPLREREALDRFFDALEAGADDVVYGHDAVEEALEYEAVETLLVSTDLPAEEVQSLEADAEGIGADCVVVPAETERGEQLREAFEGVAALLRFPIE